MKYEAIPDPRRQASFSCPGNGPFRLCFQLRQPHNAMIMTTLWEAWKLTSVTSTADKGEVNKAALGLHPWTCYLHGGREDVGD
jgi:hypothetical protein